MSADLPGLDAAVQAHQKTLEYLREMAFLYVTERGGSVDLGTFNLYMKTLSRNDTLISEAANYLLNRNRLRLTVDRLVVVPPKDAA